MRISRLLLATLMVGALLGANIEVRGSLRGTPKDWTVSLEASTNVDPGSTRAMKRTVQIARPLLQSERVSRLPRKIATKDETKEAIGEAMEQFGQFLAQSIGDGDEQEATASP